MKLYVFLTRRPIDAQAWPVVYTNEQLAHAASHRVSRIVAVEVPEDPEDPPKEDRDELSDP